MIEDMSRLAGDAGVSADVAVVGAGPAGIVTALELAGRGFKVLLIESGGRSFDSAVQQLSDAAEWDHHRHAPMSIAVRRQVGGTSVIWGGRCVPYDPVDFDVRPLAGSVSWPVTYDEMRGYFQRASDWCVCGRAVFSTTQMTHLPREMIPGLVDGEVTSSSLERWSLPTNFGKVYLDRLEQSPQVRVLTGLTCLSAVCVPETQQVDYLDCRTTSGKVVRVSAKAYVLACGGLESTRLLLASTGADGRELGNQSDHLGQWYMGHLEGVVANVRLSTPPGSTIYDYEQDIDGVYIRRRWAFTREFQLAQDLPNIASWLTNPELPDARHGNGTLSFIYLALTSPLGPKMLPDAQRLSLTGTEVPGAPYGRTVISRRSSHLRNIVNQPYSTARFMVGFGARRFLVRGRRPPGFFAWNKMNVYPLQYHGEQLPNPNSRVSLSREVDALGMRKLNIDLRFSDADVDGVVRAHQHWDDYLRSSGVGRLEYLHSDVHAAVADRLGGGFHQIGTTRMSATPAGGVVDKNLAVHGVENLFVASSSSFVTSGQANSTFMVVAFAVRLADHLGNRLRPS
jgi:choline dehydrogenase-like flavoprotein